MRKGIVWIAAAAAGALPVVAAQSAEPAKAKAAPVAIGERVKAGWDATTLESATTDEQKKILAEGEAVTVTGEVVDYSCYLQLGKRGESHRECGRKCILNGQPIGLRDAKGTLYLIIPEEHHPRRDGTVSLRETFAELVAEQVTVSGMLSRVGNDRALFVKAAPLTPKRR